MIPRPLTPFGRGILLVVGGLLGLLLTAGVATCRAQVVLDGKFGTSGPLAGPNYSIPDSLGSTRGNNLFQSFARFNLTAGEVATFSGPANIQNILSRVTGGSPSSINGTIRSDIAGANFYFINPNGIIFGPKAAVNVSGSFAASTANYLKLADGARFVAALDADDSGLSTAPVSAFGFLGETPGSITVQQSTLRVPNLQAITLVGGDIAVDGGALLAPVGKINLASVRSAGEVPVDPKTPSVAEFSAAFPVQGQITLENGARLDASGTGGGRIVIRGGQLVVDNSRIQANSTGTTAGQGIDIAVVDNLDLLNGGQIKSLSTTGRGAGGNISLMAQSIRLDGGGLVDETGSPSTQIATTSGDPFLGGGAAKGGDIMIQTGSLELVNSAQISSATFGAGNAGRIEITASSVLLDPRLPALVSEISANTWRTSGGGRAGDIVIRTDTLDLLNGASLLAATFGSGSAGLIDITASKVNMANFGVITPATFGAGNGGSVKMTADSVLLDASFIQAVTRFNSTDLNAAKGGNISITAGSIELRNGAQISATTLGSGAGGSINLTADSIRLTGDNGVSGSLTGIRSASGQDLGGGLVLVGNGDGGDIIIQPKSQGALDLVVADGAQISTETLGSGSAGQIDISGSSLRLSRRGSISSASSSLDAGAGPAGNVHVTVRNSILLTEQSLITTEAPSASGGSISLMAGSEIQLMESKITAQAGPGGGGNITLMAPSMIYLLNSTLTAEALGDGGNLMIDPVFFIMNNSALISRSSSANGGNITILSDFFFQSASLIDSSAPFGLPGTVSVSAPALDLSGSLVGLPANLLDAETQLRPDCRVRLAANLSSFVVLGRGGLPIAPDGFVPSGASSPWDEAK